MTELTRITDEKKIGLVVRYAKSGSGDVMDLVDSTVRVQLEHCQKELDAMTVSPEVLEATIQLRIGEKVKEIFKEIEWGDGLEIIILDNEWWQALKERVK